MKLLVISHNPVSRYNAMGKTIASFLAAMKPEEVCQLYLYPSYPCPQVCGSFYRITDKDVLRGLPGGKIEPERIGQDVSGFSYRKKTALYGTVLKNKPPVRLARDILWSSASWYTRALRVWLEQEQPDCIFAAGGDAAFLYQMALTLSRDYRLPLVAYLCDEYYFSAPEKGLTGRLWHLLRKRNMEKFLNHAAHAVVISPEMKCAYASRFSLPITTILTGSSREIRQEVQISKQVDALTYVGNIAYGRYRSLAAIGKALDQINRKLGTALHLDIYSSQNDPAAQAALKRVSTIRFHGFAPWEELVGVQLLVHVEDFAPRNAELVRHSISTKIADALASGIPLFAYGPETVASMAYLIRNDCAIVSVREETLEETLCCAIFDADRRRAAAENGLATARKYHDRRKNSRAFREILESVIAERKESHEAAFR